MQIAFIACLVILFFLIIAFANLRDSAPLLSFGIVVALILGFSFINSGVEVQTGINSTVSEDNRTITHTDIYEQVNEKWDKTFGLIFFLMSLWLLFVLMNKRGS